MEALGWDDGCVGVSSLSLLLCPFCDRYGTTILTHRKMVGYSEDGYLIFGGEQYNFCLLYTSDAADE